MLKKRKNKREFSIIKLINSFNTNIKDIKRKFIYFNISLIDKINIFSITLKVLCIINNYWTFESISILYIYIFDLFNKVIKFSLYNFT